MNTVIHPIEEDPEAYICHDCYLDPSRDCEGYSILPPTLPPLMRNTLKACANCGQKPKEFSILYCCRECGKPVKYESEDDVLYCPEHPQDIVDSVVIGAK